MPRVTAAATKELATTSATSTSTSGTSIQRRSWLRSVARLLRIARLLDQVAHAAHRADLDAVGLELLAHPVHRDLHRVGAHVLAPAEQAVEDLLLGHHP